MDKREAYKRAHAYLTRLRRFKNDVRMPACIMALSNEEGFSPFFVRVLTYTVATAELTNFPLQPLGADESGGGIRLDVVRNTDCGGDAAPERLLGGLDGWVLGGGVSELGMRGEELFLMDTDWLVAAMA